jgi:hypothetical protein
VPWNFAFFVPCGGSAFWKPRIQEKSANELVARCLYRKAPLFDRFVKFNVQIERIDIRH